MKVGQRVKVIVGLHSGKSGTITCELFSLGNLWYCVLLKASPMVHYNVLYRKWEITSSIGCPCSIPTCVKHKKDQ